MPISQSTSIEIKRVKGKGRGVFARRLIRRGEVIERVPMLVMSSEEFSNGLAKTSLANYCFQWGKDQTALALGYGSIYNHSFQPNACYEDDGPRTKAFRAIRDIAPGEEITVNYNGKPKSRSAVWFNVVESASPKPKESAKTRKS